MVLSMLTDTPRSLTTVQGSIERLESSKPLLARYVVATGASLVVVEGAEMALSVEEAVV